MKTNKSQKKFNSLKDLAVLLPDAKTVEDMEKSLQAPDAQKEGSLFADLVQVGTYQSSQAARLEEKVARKEEADKKAAELEARENAHLISLGKRLHDELQWKRDAIAQLEEALRRKQASQVKLGMKVTGLDPVTQRQYGEAKKEIADPEKRLEGRAGKAYLESLKRAEPVKEQESVNPVQRKPQQPRPAQNAKDKGRFKQRIQGVFTAAGLGSLSSAEKQLYRVEFFGQKEALFRANTGGQVEVVYTFGRVMLNGDLAEAGQKWRPGEIPSDIYRRPRFKSWYESCNK